MRYLAVLAVLLLGGQDNRQVYTDAYYKLATYLCDKRVDLGDWCKSHALFREAKGHYNFLVLNIPEYRSKAQARLNGEWKKKPNSITPEKWAEYQKKLLEYFQGCGDRCWKVYQAAKKAKLAKEAAEALAKTVEFYIDHEEARKERGEEKVEGFGWVPKAEAELVRAAVDSSKDQSAKNDDHEAWDSSWVIKSGHFIMRTTYPWKDAVAALNRLEQLHTFFYDAMGSRMKPPSTRMALYYFRLDAEAEKIRARVPGAPDVGSHGFFHAGTNVAYIKPWGDECHTLLHEATHMLAHNGLDQVTVSFLQQADVRSDSPDNYWVMEGIAEYFATIRQEGDTWVVGKTGKFSKLKPPPMREYLGKDFPSFQVDSITNYYIAFALSSFLVEAGDGKRKAAFLDFIKEYYLGNSSLETLEKALGLKIPDLETEFLEWIKVPKVEKE